MRLIINRDVILDNLLTIQRGLPVKTPMPIFMAIKFEAYEDYLVLTSCNSDISIQIQIFDDSLDVKQTGKVAIPGKILIDIIRKVTFSTIELSLLDDYLLTIKAGKSEFTLKILDIDDYPNIDFMESDEPIVLHSSVLNNIIKETNYATSSSEKRPILTGLNFKYNDNKLLCLATDSYRLSKKEINLRTNNKNFEIVIPAKTLDELSKIIELIDSDIEIYISATKTLFKTNNIMFQTRLLEGAYPDATRIIPVDYAVILSFNKEELIAVVERVSILSPRDNNINYSIIKFILDESGIIKITSKNNEIGNATDEIIPCSDIIGDQIKIAFSSKYLIDSLKSFSNSTEVTLKFAGENRPFIIEGNNEEDLLNLILPVRID